MLKMQLLYACYSIDEKLQESDEWRRDLAYSPGIRNLIRWLWTDVCGANWLPKVILDVFKTEIPHDK